LSTALVNVHGNYTDSNLMHSSYWWITLWHIQHIIYMFKITSYQVCEGICNLICIAHMKNTT